MVGAEYREKDRYLPFSQYFQQRLEYVGMGAYFNF